MGIRLLSLLCLIGLLQACSSAADTGKAEAAVAEFHTQLDQGQYADIYAQASDDFKKAATQADFAKLLGAVHRKLGAVKSSQKMNWRLNFGVGGETIALSYKTSFAGGDAQESFVYHMNGDRAELYGYNINSNALIVN